MRLQRLACRGRDRHRDLEGRAFCEAEVEVLAQQRRRERRGPSRLTRAGNLYFVKVEPITLLLMKSKKACRGTPAFCVRIVISARFWMTTPSMTLCAILQMRASSPSPT